jgi:hypothetical protein
MARGGRSRLLSELRQLPAHDNPLRRLWGLDGQIRGSTTPANSDAPTSLIQCSLNFAR